MPKSCRQLPDAPQAAPSPRDQISAEAPHNCTRCPRLADFIVKQRLSQPDWFNAPVPSFGASDAKLLIVGLAPGLQGANRTGRPFTGDYAGDLLYATLLDQGFAKGSYDAHPDDRLELQDCMITNAVRCVPPANKPKAAEINTCRAFLMARIAALPNLRVLLLLGRIAHDSTLRGLGAKLKDHPFGHGARHDLPAATKADPTRRLAVYDSYHCSRYNTNTGRLTADMFTSVFKAIAAELTAADK